MHILEYLTKIGKAGPSSSTCLFLGRAPLLKDAPALDFSGITFIDELYLHGYKYNLILPDAEEIRDFGLAGYDKILQADKLKSTTSLGLNGYKGDMVSLPALQDTYNLALYNFPGKFNAPSLTSVGQLYFDNKTQLTLASGQKLISLPGYDERGFGIHSMRGGDFTNKAFRGGINAQARPGIYNVYGKTVYMNDSYYHHVDTVGPGIYDIMWNHDEKLLLLQNGDAQKFVMQKGNKFFEGADYGECIKKYREWQNTVFITDFKLEPSLGYTTRPDGSLGQELYITAFYSDGTLAAYNEFVGFDKIKAQEKLQELQAAKNLKIHQFYNICSR